MSDFPETTTLNITQEDIDISLEKKAARHFRPSRDCPVSVAAQRHFLSNYHISSAFGGIFIYELMDIINPIATYEAEKLIDYQNQFDNTDTATPETFQLKRKVSK